MYHKHGSLVCVLPRHDSKSGACEICRTPRRKLVLDHDHETGFIRGWICQSCNVHLGKAQAHDIPLTQMYLDYLSRNQEI